MNTDLVELFLSCESWQEAHNIADVLLEKRLVAHAEFIPVTSNHHWKQAMDAVEGVKLIVQSVASNVANIEAVVKDVCHSNIPALHVMTATVQIDDAVVSWTNDSEKV
jgi:uncharacterized protein involved in tolerance to divalent cations